MKRPKPDDLQCSFCHKAQDVVGKLISSPSDYPRAYICDECVAVCTSILQDDGMLPPAPRAGSPERPSHCLMCHPMAHNLLLLVEQWIAAESAGGGADRQLQRMRETARLMMGLDPS